MISRWSRSWSFLSIAAVLIIIGFAAPVRAQGVAQEFSVEGRLSYNNGGAVSKEAKQFTFALYNASSGGTALWSEETRVQLDAEGAYHHVLGSITPFASTFNWNQGLWLGVGVKPDPEMTPRVKLLATPFAINADLVDGFHASATPTANSLIALDASALLPAAALPVVTPDKGGLGLSTFATGDLLYASGASALARLAVGSAGQVLGVGAGGLLEWTTPAIGTSTFLALTDSPSAFTGAGGQLLRVNTGATALEFVDGTTVFETANGNIQTHVSATSNVHGLTFTGEGAGGGLDADTVDGQEAAAFAAASHTHAAGDLASGTLAIARLPTGTSSTTVALGDHAHTGVYEAANANIQAHVSATSNVHGLTFTGEGAGGGLDADSVDGVSSASFLRTDSSTSVTTGNTLTTNAGSTLNVAGTWQVGGVAVTSSAAELNLLTGRSGTVWTSANDGAASTLDADLLDGISSAAFLRADAGSNVATGNTLTTDAGSTLNVAGTWKLGGTTVNATAANLNTLVGGGATTLHSHAGTALANPVRANFGAQTLTTIGGQEFKDLTLSGESFDPDNLFNTGTSTYTAPNTGYYQVSVQLSLNNDATNPSVFAVLYKKNGAEVSWGTFATIEPAAANAYATSTIVDIVSCSAGDTLTFQVFFNSNIVSVGVLSLSRRSFVTIQQVK